MGRAARVADERPNIEPAFRSALAERLGSSRFDVWFGDGVRLGVDGGTLVVGVPNGFFRDWIRGHYAADLAATAEAVVGRRLDLRFEIDAEADPRIGRIDPAPRAPRPSPPVGPPVEPIGPPHLEPSRPDAVPSHAEPGPRPSPGPRFDLGTPAPPAPQVRPSPRRLEDFVAGPGSRLALAAFSDMTATLGASFNPLFVHGGIGLGKSHLLEGLATAVRARHPGRRIIHVTAEGFTNHFLDALRTAALPTFRSRYRAADVLVIDDIHFIAAKRATQDEFLHTFNAVVGAGAAVVLSADQHPRQIPKLTDELATRFLGGMVVKLDAPDPATRRAILRAKAAIRGVDVPEGVVAYLADHLRGSVRELEGAIASVIAHASLTGRRLDLALAKTALRDTIRHVAQAVAVKDVERVVCRLFDLDAERLRSDGRAQAITQPRMLAMFVARRHSGASYSEIGRHFGGRNHSTVISAEKKVRAWLEAERRQALFHGFETIGDALAAIERELGV